MASMRSFDFADETRIGAVKSTLDEAGRRAPRMGASLPRWALVANVVDETDDPPRLLPQHRAIAELGVPVAQL